MDIKFHDFGQNSVSFFFFFNVVNFNLAIWSLNQNNVTITTYAFEHVGLWFAYPRACIILSLVT